MGTNEKLIWGVVGVGFVALMVYGVKSAKKFNDSNYTNATGKAGVAHCHIAPVYPPPPNMYTSATPVNIQEYVDYLRSRVSNYAFRYNKCCLSLNSPHASS